MRKLIAVLCIVAMMLMAVPALANPSASSTVTVLTEDVTVAPVVTSDIADDGAKEVVEAVNGEGVMTPSEAVTAILGAGADELKDVEGYSFTSQFNSIDAPEFPVDIEISGADENTKLMLINPETGDLVIIEANDDGSFTIPFAGLFATMDPTP